MPHAVTIKEITPKGSQFNTLPIGSYFKVKEKIYCKLYDLGWEPNSLLLSTGKLVDIPSTGSTKKLSAGTTITIVVDKEPEKTVKKVVKKKAKLVRPW